MSHSALLDAPTETPPQFVAKWRPLGFSVNVQPLDAPGAVAELSLRVALPAEHARKWVSHAEERYQAHVTGIHRQIEASPEFLAWKAAHDRLEEYRTHAEQLRPQLVEEDLRIAGQIARGEIAPKDIAAVQASNSSIRATLAGLDKAIPALAASCHELAWKASNAAKAIARKVHQAAMARLAEREKTLDTLLSMNEDAFAGLLVLGCQQQRLSSGLDHEASLFLSHAIGEIPPPPIPQSSRLQLPPPSMQYSDPFVRKSEVAATINVGVPQGQRHGGPAQ